MKFKYLFLIPVKYLLIPLFSISVVVIYYYNYYYYYYYTYTTIPFLLVFYLELSKLLTCKLSKLRLFVLIPILTVFVFVVHAHLSLSSSVVTYIISGNFTLADTPVISRGVFKLEQFLGLPWTSPINTKETLFFPLVQPSSTMSNVDKSHGESFTHEMYVRRDNTTTLINNNCIPKTGTRYLCVKAYGRLGNALFAYASSLGVARKNNLTILLTESYESMNDSFTFQELFAQNKECDNIPNVRIERGCCIFYEYLMEVGRDCGRFLQVASYLQSWRYFQHVVPEVRQKLRFRGKVYEQAHDILDKIRKIYSTGAIVNGKKQNETDRSSKDGSTSVILVGVHVRHDDITVVQAFIDHGYLVPPLSYYDHAMSYFLQNFTNVVFIIATDDPTYVTNHVLPLCVTIGARCNFTMNDALTDMAVLAGCDHMIVSVGTFGWWAGWLSGGQVIYYKNPIRKDSVLMRRTNYNDYFIPQWIGLE